MNRHQLNLSACTQHLDRWVLLEKQLAFLQSAFDDLPELLLRFVQRVPQRSNEPRWQDAESFLRWLTRRFEMTAEQRDHVLCQRARHAIERKAARLRIPYLRFLECSSVAKQLLGLIDGANGARIIVNPVHAWACFRTPALLDGLLKPPAGVLFNALSGQIHVSVPSADDRRRLRQLALLGPVTLAEWRQLEPGTEHEQLLKFIRYWTEQGMVAFL
jgi:hypothetical protein